MRPTLHYETHFARFEVGHWGAVDGRTGRTSRPTYRTSTWWIGSSTWMMVQGCERIERGDGTRGPHHPHGQPTDRRDTYLVHPTRTCAVRKLQDFATPSIG